MNYCTNTPKSYFTDVARKCLEHFCIMQAEMYFHDMAKGAYAGKKTANTYPNDPGSVAATPRRACYGNQPMNVGTNVESAFGCL